VSLDERVFTDGLSHPKGHIRKVGSGMSHELFFPFQMSTIHVRRAHETVEWPAIAAQTGPIVRHDDLLMTQQVLTFNPLDARHIDETQVNAV
jgi:hypothetical protein